MTCVAIVGGGPAGLALALHLHGAGIDCEVMDARPSGAAHGDRRVLALSHGSRQILERLGTWRHIDATPIAAIHVSQQGRLGRALIRAKDAGVPALGHVAEAGKLGAVLAQACAAAGVTIRHDTRVERTDLQPGSMLLHCAAKEGRTVITAQLVAWAEGAVSGTRITRRDYGQQAIVATLRTQPPSNGVAYERFTVDGPAALLPLGDRLALVWTVPDAAVPSLLALDDDGFLSRVHGIFSGRLEFTAVGERTAFPLGLRFRESPVGDRAVWLGNAAQTLHPVAGQGFNLALRDVSQLSRLLQESPADCGNAELLARHAAARRLDRQGVIGFTDGLIRIFGLRSGLAHHARGAGLLALDLLPVARRFLARRMIFGARAW